MVSQNVEADAAVGVDVGVVDAGCEVNFRRLEGVIGREVDGEEENTARVGRVALMESQYYVSSTNITVVVSHSGPLSVTRSWAILTGPMIVACQWNFCCVSSESSCAH